MKTYSDTNVLTNTEPGREGSIPTGKV